MAKINGMLSYTGKLGQTVGMKGQDGETYVRINTKPANPKSSKQVDQRVKFSLAGQLSKLTPIEAIYGLGSSKRKRRSRFTSIIARNAVVTTGDGITTAKLDPQNLIFSDGNQVLVPAFQATLDNGVVTLKAASFPDGVDAVLAVIVSTNADREEYISVQTALIDSISAMPTVTIPSGAQANIYYIPVLQASGATSVSYQRAIDNLRDSEYATQAEILTSGVFSYGRSVLSSTVTPA